MAPLQRPEVTLQFTLYKTSSAIIAFFVGHLTALQSILNSMGFLALSGVTISSSKESTYLQTMADMAGTVISNEFRLFVKTGFFSIEGCSSISDCLQQSNSKNGSWPDLQNRAKYAAMSLVYK